MGQRRGQRATWLIWLGHNLEGIAERLANICQRVLYAGEGKIEELNLSKC